MHGHNIYAAAAWAQDSCHYCSTETEGKCAQHVGTLLAVCKVQLWQSVLAVMMLKLIPGLLGSLARYALVSVTATVTLN